MKLLLIGVEIRDEPRITIARFQSGLNYEIRDRVATRKNAFTQSKNSYVI